MVVTEDQVDSIKEDIRALSDTVSAVLFRVDRHDTRFDQLDKQLGEHTTRFDQLDKQLAQHNARFDQLDKQLAQHNTRFDQLDGTLREILALVRK